MHKIKKHYIFQSVIGAQDYLISSAKKGLWNRCAQNHEPLCTNSTCFMIIDTYSVSILDPRITLIFERIENEKKTFENFEREKLLTWLSLSYLDRYRNSNGLQKIYKQFFIFLTFYILQRFIKRFLSFWIYVVVLHFIFLGFLFSGFNIFYVV